MEVDAVTNKAQLLDLIRAERGRLEAVLARVPMDRMALPGEPDAWSVKDTLAHITAWEQRMVRWLRQAVDGGVPSDRPPAGSDTGWADSVNEVIYQQNRNRPLADVQAGFAASYLDALRAVEETPEEDLFDPQRFSWRGGQPLWILVAANTFWHYAEHAEAIAHAATAADQG